MRILIAEDDQVLADGLLRALRADGGLPGVPAVVVSASAHADEIVRARDAGFDGFWTKPLELQRTLSELDALLAAPQ